MDDDKLNLYTKDELLSLGIYELRDLGRDVGVPSPTTLKKEALVDKILSIIYGEIPKRSVGKGRGRPVRAKDKPNRIYVDLIEKLETPKCDSVFIYSDKDYSDVNVDGLLSSRVASAKSRYVNSNDFQEDKVYKSGVICEEDGKLYVRKFKFIKSDSDVEVPSFICNDYVLKENDLVDYLLDDDGQTMLMLFKINGNLAQRKVKNFNNLESKNNEIEIEELKVVLGKTNILNESTLQDRCRIVDNLSIKMENLNYSVVKVCFDRNSSCKSNDCSATRSEIFASYVGDEFETMAMIESGLDKAVFYAMIGCKTALIIDNLAWLLSVIETYPTTLYGNFIEKMIKICQNSNITLVCVTGYLGNEKVKELSGLFDNIN